MKETLLKNRNFAYFLSAQAISQLGDWIHWVTILSFVYESTRSGIAMASVSVALTVTRIATAPFAGVIADRYDRKMIMISTDFLQAVFVSLFLFDVVLKSMQALLLIVVCVSILSSVYEPTKRCVVPMIMKKEEILKANSLMQTVMNALWVFGPVAGGGLIALFGFKCGFLFNALTFLISGLLTVGIQLRPLQEESREQPEKNFMKELKTGLKYIRWNHIVFTLFASAFIQMLGGGSVNALMAALPNDVYKFSTRIGYALLLSFTGTGWVLGSFFLFGYAKKMQRLDRKLWFWFITGICSGLTIVLVVNTPLFFIGCMIWFFHGVFNCVRDVIETTVVQETVSDEVMGRVFSVQGLLIELASITSMSIGGFLYSSYGIKVVFSYAGFMEVLSVFIGFFFLYRVILAIKKGKSFKISD